MTPLYVSWLRLLEWSMAVEGDSHWFVTQTFRNELPEARAKHLSDRWLARLSQATFALTGHRLRWVRVREWQRRGVVHFHLLVSTGGLALQSRKRWEERWQVQGGGLIRIYNAEEGAAPYLAKELNKSAGGDLELGGFWRGLHPPAALSNGLGGNAEALVDRLYDKAV